MFLTTTIFTLLFHPNFSFVTNPKHLFGIQHAASISNEDKKLGVLLFLHQNDDIEKPLRHRRRRRRIGSTISSETSSSVRRMNDNDDNRKDEYGKIKDIVMKFGGSSIANGDRIDYVTRLIRDQIEGGKYRPRAVVCSAMGKTTNNLLDAGQMALEGKVDMDKIRSLHVEAMDKFDLSNDVREEVTSLLDECEDMLNGIRLIQELSPKTLDHLVSYGERCSIRIISARLTQLGIPSTPHDSWTVGILTDSNFGDAKLLHPHSENQIRSAFESIDPDIVPIITGFIGQDCNQQITTLGRGGSDLTATAIGAACQFDEVQVWKDVDGILTADPRLVGKDKVLPVPRVTYEEASELAYFGAQVLHPIAMQPAWRKGVRVRVKNSYNPAAVGTVICERGGGEEEEEEEARRLVTAITCKRNIKLMDIQSTQMLGAYGFLAAVFSDLEKHRLSVDVLASSEVSISLTLDDQKQDPLQISDAINRISPYADVTLHEDRAILTLIADVERSSEVLARVFGVFMERGIQVEMMSQGVSKVNISFIVGNDRIDEAILSLHDCFFGNGSLLDEQKVEVF